MVLFKIRPAASGSGFSVLFKMRPAASGSLFRVSFKIRSAASVSANRVLLKMSRVLFSVWFSIQGFIQNTTCRIWFRIQRIVKKYPGYYSASDSLFRVLFKIRPSASGSLLRVFFKSSQGLIQRMVQDSAYYSKISRELFNVRFRIQGIIQNTTCSVWCIIQGITQKMARVL